VEPGLGDSMEGDSVQNLPHAVSNVEVESLKL